MAQRRTVYRDKRSGRFVSKKKWNRSHGPEGRYRREKVGGEFKEWFVSFEYNGKRPRVLDFFVVAKLKEEVIELVNVAIFDIGHDALGYDLEWAKRVPWQQGLVSEIKPPDSQITLNRRFWKTDRVEVH